jgi:hypothetical protein
MFFNLLQSRSFLIGTSIHVLLFLLVIIGATEVSGQENKFSVIRSSADYSEIVVDFKLSDYQYSPVATSTGEEFVIHSKGGTALLRKGCPDLPKFTTSVIIPEQGFLNLEILDSSYTDYPNIHLAASRGNMLRNADPKSIPREKGLVYSKNQFFPEAAANIGASYTFRDFKGTTLVIYPFRYNPITHILRVYNHLIVRLKSNETFLSNLPKKRSINSEQNEIYARHFINFPDSRYAGLNESPKMLIICHSAFLSAMKPFVDWKLATGIDTKLVDVASIGNTPEQIRQYVKQYYEEQRMSYLMLVGDIDQIASPIIHGGTSDPSYGFIVGNDAYPEVITGRISAETYADVATQVKRFIDYERNPVSGNHFSGSCGIASDEGPGDDNELDFEHIRNIQNKLLNYTYTHKAEFYDGSQGGLDQPGNPTAEQVNQFLNSGAGIVNYSGHGSSTSFSSSGFSNQDVYNLDNFGKLPIIWSVACVNGEFNNGTCFAEAWLRATKDGQAIGGVGAFMSSINQSWDPPMSAQDEMVDLLTGLSSHSTSRTFGGISMNGCLKMNDDYGQEGEIMTGSWHLFGDPSLVVRTTNPAALTISHSAETFLGTTQFTVNCATENARIALVQNGVLLGSAIVSGGIASVSVSALVALDTVFVTATAFNKSPAFGFVKVRSPSNAFLVSNGFVIRDSLGNSNLRADYAEHLTLDYAFRNIGSLSSTPFTVTLYETSSDITVLNSQCIFPSLNPESTVNSENCFGIEVANGVMDQSIVPLNLTLRDQLGNEWISSSHLTVQAPKIQIISVRVDDLNGNNNGRLDPNEDAELRFRISNTGHSRAESGNARISATSAFADFMNSETWTQALAVGDTTELIFQVFVHPDAPIGSVLNTNLTASFGSYPASLSSLFKIGTVIENAETGDFSSYSWIAGAFPWTADETQSYEGTTSFRSAEIAELEESVLTLDYQTEQSDSIRFYARVSSEEGWDFLSFYINGVFRHRWSGVKNWQRYSFPVSPGLTEFRWVYAKDDQISSNEDAAWIDYIELPPGYSTGNNQSIQNQALNQSGWKLFPNPGNGLYWLENSTGVNEHVEINLIDCLGRKIQTWNKDSNGSALQFHCDAGVEGGMYFIQILSGKASQVIRLIDN